MFDGKAEQIRLFAHQAIRGAGDGDRLREYVASNAAGGISRDQQDIGYVNAVVARRLQRGEQGVKTRCRNRARNTASQPGTGQKKGAPAGMGQRQGQVDDSP